ncbi:MAG: Cd(II)/Pb(II)-responsive transcriptional regulator [Deltaproteobacteria bacterium]|jgi:DNA-binding transcriptional MerR regulator|nr:Cd(II)/Pb(II)-responsive transcriptional regulator [Deltaproteobacteria bacterium]
MYQIGKLASLTGVQPMTIRYYEKIGLLDKPERQENGYRYYGDLDLEKLNFIRHCREHGFALDEIKILLELKESPTANCDVVDALLESHVQKLEEQLASLASLKKQLVSLRQKCRVHGSIAHCGIMMGLMNRSLCPCGERHGAPAPPPGGESAPPKAPSRVRDRRKKAPQSA